MSPFPKKVEYPFNLLNRWTDLIFFYIIYSPELHIWTKLLQDAWIFYHLCGLMDWFKTLPIKHLVLELLFPSIILRASCMHGYICSILSNLFMLLNWQCWTNPFFHLFYNRWTTSSRVKNTIFVLSHTEIIRLLMLIDFVSLAFIFSGFPVFISN